MGSFRNIWKVQFGGFSSLRGTPTGQAQGREVGTWKPSVIGCSPGEEPRESPSFSQGSRPMAVLLLILTVA